MPAKVIRVLLVDDDEDDYILTKDILSEIHHTAYQLEWAPSFDKGLLLIISGNYDISLIDFRLGQRSGVELVQEAIRRGSRKPAIILTGQEDAGIDLIALKAGASDYLIKGKLDSYNLEKAITYSIERTQVFEDIFEKEQKYSTLFENSNDGIFITDSEFRLLEVNNCTLNLFGYTKEEVLRLSFSSLFASSEEFRHFSNSIINNTDSRSQEYLLRSKKHEKLICLITSGVIKDVAGNVKGYQGIIHDISQRKKYEMQQLASEKMGVTDRIVSTIAHEVRNPLNTIVLALGRFKKEHPNEESYNFYTDIIDKSCKRIDQLISQLIESSRPAELHLQVGSVNQLLDDTLKLADDRIKLLNIEIVKKYGDDLPVFPFDGEKLKIAFLNIIINAIEAMTAEVGILAIQTQFFSRNIYITIEDNGKGIPKENISKLFDPYFTGKKNGMGLGLTSTYTIVKSHGGEINVESQPGVGTRFTIAFDISTLAS